MKPLIYLAALFLIGCSTQPKKDEGLTVLNQKLGLYLQAENDFKHSTLSPGEFSKSVRYPGIEPVFLEQFLIKAQKHAQSQ